MDKFADYMVKDVKNGECFRADHLLKGKSVHLFVYLLTMETSGMHLELKSLYVFICIIHGFLQSERCIRFDPMLVVAAACRLGFKYQFSAWGRTEVAGPAEITQGFNSNTSCKDQRLALGQKLEERRRSRESMLFPGIAGLD